MSDTEWPELPLRISEFQAPGPVSRAFLNDRTKIRGIMGPQGSGKTTTCLFDGVGVAAELPGCDAPKLLRRADDGRGWIADRYFSGAIIRDTYTNLWNTTVRSWHKFFPSSMGDWTGGLNRPAEHRLKLRNPYDGSFTNISMRFRAIGEGESIEDALKGSEYTWIHLNEGDRLSRDVKTFCIGRIGRYPGQDMFQTQTDFFHGIVMDLNPPDTDNYVYEDFVEDPKPLHKFFRQPGGRSPGAENMTKLPRGYYETQAAANAHNPWWVRSMVDGEFSYSREGKPVYDGYDDVRHCSTVQLDPIRGLPLGLSFDQGIKGPAMLVTQYSGEGQLRLLREFVPGRTGASMFGQRCRHLLNSEFQGMPTEASADVDPAGLQGSVTEDAHYSWKEIVEKELGIPLIPAETNELDIRLDGVAQMLSTDIRAGTPSFIMDPRCIVMRKGFNSHYRYKKRQTGDFEDKPEKNMYADPQDALQYKVLRIFGRQGVINGDPRKMGIPSQRAGVPAVQNAKAQMQSSQSVDLSARYGGPSMPAPGAFNVFDL